VVLKWGNITDIFPAVVTVQPCRDHEISGVVGWSTAATLAALSTPTATPPAIVAGLVGRRFLPRRAIGAADQWVEGDFKCQNEQEGSGHPWSHVSYVPHVIITASYPS
jgi:hypothetical protein